MSIKAYTYKQFLSDFARYRKLMYTEAKRIGETFREVSQLMKTNWSNLHKVLDRGFDKQPVPFSPNLKYWIGDGKELSDVPLEGEQKLFNHIVDYLFDYYKVEKGPNSLDDLFKKAESDPNNIQIQEVFYELSQIFSAFGHSSASDMQQERLKKLKLYDSKRTFKPDMKIMYEAVKLVAAESAQHVNVITNVTKSLDNPFQEKGERNVGTPFWLRTSTRVNNVRVEELCFNLANQTYQKYSKSKEYNVKLASIPATMFGRNSTKGVETKFEGGQYKILKYSASPRVIYGVSLVANTNLARLYYSVLENMKHQPAFLPLQGTPGLRKWLPKIASFDAKHGSYRISSDKSRYDTTLSVELMICNMIADQLAFGHTSKISEIILSSLYVDALTPIVYKDNPKSQIKWLKTLGGHKSGFYNTLRWGSQTGNIITKYTKLRIDRKWFYDTYRLYSASQIPMDYFQGDDWSSVFKDHSMYEKAARIEADEFGLISNTRKSAFGTWIVQNGMNSKGGVSYPLARALRSFYYPERTTRNKPPFVLLMTAYSAIENLWESPHLEYFIREHLLKTDRFKGGILDADGKELTFGQFYEIYKKQAQDYAGGKIFNTNDPRWEGILDDEGQPKSEWLHKIWDKIKSMY